MNDSALAVVSIAGSMLSLIGVGVALWQVLKTRRAADAARSSAARTHQLLTQNLLLSDLTSASTVLDGVKGMIRSKRYEAALVRVSDLMNHLNQIKTLPHTFQGTMGYAEILGQLHIVRDVLERRLNDERATVDAIRVLAFLSRISDELNTWIGQAKFALPKGSDHDT